MSTNTVDPRYQLDAGPTRTGAIVDIVLYVLASAALWGVEEALRAAGWLPLPDVYEGGPTLIASFFVVLGLMHWRKQSWRDFGLRRPGRWWFIPAWGFVVILVNIAAQLTIVPLLATILNAPSPDLSRYDALTGNLKIFLIVTPGAMITGGFIEEFIYRGMMVDRLARVFGGGRRGLVAAALCCGLPFGLVHFQWGVGGMLVTAVMGGVLGLMYLATRRNLWPLVAGHAVLDAVLLTQVYLGAFSQGT
jgi:membrane protease YdiL (CAAX protease family)